MKTLRKLSPHGVILIGNMYYVFWGIDRVNKTMNFIDNGYTKLMLLLMIAFAVVNVSVLLPFLKKQLRIARAPKATYARMSVLGLNAALCVAVFILLTMDRFAEKSMLFLNEFIKAILLSMCVTSQLCAIYMASRQRAGARRRMQTKKK